MGQRLNIEIVSNGMTLANAYYHWGAYTGSALALTESAIEAYSDLVVSCKGPFELAIRLLERTGAGLNDEERMRVSECSKYAMYQYNDCVDRNNGLLSVTQQGISSTEMWEEGRVTINIDEESVVFGVCNEVKSLDEFMDYYCFDTEEEASEKYMALPEIDFDFDELSFDDFGELVEVYQRSYDTYGFRRPDGSAIMWVA